MTYTAFLALAILRDDFSKLDRPGIIKFLHSCQREDGRWWRLLYILFLVTLPFVYYSFSTVPGSNESDLRTLYCAFAISSMLDDWSGVNVPLAISFVSTCRVRAFFGFWFSILILPFIGQNRLMKADMANLLFVKRKVCAWIFFKSRD